MNTESFNIRMQKLGEQFREYLATVNKVSLIYAYVKSVDPSTRIVSCETLAGYTLNASVDFVTSGAPKTVVCWPAVGSLVVLGFIEDDPGICFLVDQLVTESVSVSFDGGSTVNISKDSISLQAGEGAALNLGSLAQLTNLKDTLLSIVDFVNTFVSTCTVDLSKGNIITGKAQTPLVAIKNTINQNLQ